MEQAELNQLTSQISAIFEKMKSEPCECLVLSRLATKISNELPASEDRGFEIISRHMPNTLGKCRSTAKCATTYLDTIFKVAMTITILCSKTDHKEKEIINIIRKAIPDHVISNIENHLNESLTQFITFRELIAEDKSA